MEQEHPICQVCGLPAPKDVRICTRCGAERVVPDEVPVAAVVEEPWSIIGYGPTTVQANPHTQAVMNMLSGLKSPANNWWNHGR